MICSNCGFQNAADDQFCGSCGKFLDWTGAADSGGAQPETTSGPSTDQPASDETQVVPTVTGPPPPPATPPSQSVPPRPEAQPYRPAPSLAAGIVCWNCGQHNPAARSFCQRCGEQLAVGAASGAAAGGRGRPPGRYQDDYYDDDGGGRGRTIAIAVALLAILLLAGGALFMFLGGGFGQPGPSPTDAGAVSPSPEASPTDEASPSPEPSPSPDVTTEPAPTAETPEPTVEPPVTPTPPPPPTPTPTPTPMPTPANCDGFGSPTTSTTLTNENPTRQISNGRVWCVSALVFGDGQGDGTLKIFLTNPVFLTSEYGYSSATIGWTEVFMLNGQFNGSDAISPPMDLIHPTLDQTRAYRMFPQGTEIQLQVMCDGGSDCAGSVRIDHERRPAPRLP